MRILIDADVPNSVVEFLRGRGHEVTLSRAVVLPGAADPLVAAAASTSGAVVLTWNKKHFLSLVKQRRGPMGPYRYPGMHLLTFDNCTHVEGLQRLQLLIDDLESTHRLRTEVRGHRFVAIVGRTYVRFEDLP